MDLVTSRRLRRAAARAAVVGESVAVLVAVVAEALDSSSRQS